MLKTHIHKFARYLLGKKSNKQYIVFESDDWGSIGMPDLATRKFLFNNIPEMAKDAYARFDTLASPDDLTALFDVLSKYRDTNGNHPIITANTIMANPDFVKIKQNDFKKYSYERFDRTLRNYYGNQIINLWKEGVDKKVFYPQLHGREHVHALSWLNELQNNNSFMLLAFNHNCYKAPGAVNQGYQRKNLSAALNLSGLAGEDEFHRNYLTESYQLFEDYFGFKSKSFIATAYIWNKNHEKILANLGVKVLQGLGYQYSPINENAYSRIFHYHGQKNNVGLQYLVRNAFFEPTLNPKADNVNNCLKRINLAFKFKLPAIIGTHRLNFIGSLEENNRQTNLKLFDVLLNQILNRWPNAEFTTSDKIFKT